MDFRSFAPAAFIAALIGAGSAVGVLRTAGAEAKNTRLGHFPTQLDLGTLVEGQTIEMDVPLGPLDPALLAKIKGQTSCGCTTFILPTTQANGEGATVKIRFDSTGKGAEIHESVAFAWDEKGTQSTECKLNGWIVGASNPPLTTKLLTPGAQTVHLEIPFARETAPWKVESDGLTVKRVAQRDGRLIVDGTLQVPDRPNPELGTLKISHHETTINAPFQIQSAATWKSVPMILNFGVIHPDRVSTRQARLELRTPARLLVDQAPPGVEARLASSDDRHWTLSVSTSDRVKSLLNSKIVLRRSSGQKIVIPIVGVSANPNDPRPLGG